MVKKTSKIVRFLQQRSNFFFPKSLLFCFSTFIDSNEEKRDLEIIFDINMNDEIQRLWKLNVSFEGVTSKSIIGNLVVKRQCGWQQQVTSYATLNYRYKMIHCNFYKPSSASGKIGRERTRGREVGEFPCEYREDNVATERGKTFSSEGGYFLFLLRVSLYLSRIYFFFHARVCTRVRSCFRSTW